MCSVWRRFIITYFRREGNTVEKRSSLSSYIKYIATYEQIFIRIQKVGCSKKKKLFVQIFQLIQTQPTERDAFKWGWTVEINSETVF